MSEATYDYSDYIDNSGPGDNALAMLSSLAEDQAKAMAEVARLEAALQKAKDRLKDIAEHKIPSAMEELGLKDFSTRSGLKIQIEEKIRASLGSGPKKEEGISWLMTNGFGGLVKQNVVVAFSRNQAEQASALAKELASKGLRAEYERKVEPATLTSWVKEQLKEGAAIPLETFGVFRQRIAKIDIPSEKGNKNAAKDDSPF